MESQDRLMGSRPFLSLADVVVAGHTQFRPDHACGAGAPTQSMKLSEDVKTNSDKLGVQSTLFLVKCIPISPKYLLIGRCNSFLKKKSGKKELKIADVLRLTEQSLAAIYGQ
ncbi:hypothetical protein HAX54_028284 [Datura stramonium]|uniref:Uncharacterized protein n=1 Tax=Datura stramonium TaxID=4076 RepID=A0ABS8V6L9_DATST|nr:hypothetical protein [Datura stramonium]